MIGILFANPFWVYPLVGWVYVTLLQIELRRGLHPKILSTAVLASILSSITSLRYREERHLTNRNPPKEWSLRFVSPAIFGGAMSRRPFPAPESMVEDWYRTWLKFSSLPLAFDELKATLSRNLAVHYFNLRTNQAWDGERHRPGVVGDMTLRDLGMPRQVRNIFDLLVAYSAFSGTGILGCFGNGLTQIAGGE